MSDVQADIARSIEAQVEDLKEVLLKEFDFLKKIGIINML